MAAPTMLIMEQDHQRFMGVLEQLSRESNAKLCFLLDKAGQQIAAAGELEDIDPTSLASLTAGNVAATEGVAQIVGHDEFSTLFHEGKNESLHITVIGNRIILLVVFDMRSSVGLVKLRVDQHSSELRQIVADVMARSEAAAAGGPGANSFSEITEEDIDALFG